MSSLALDPKSTPREQHDSQKFNLWAGQLAEIIDVNNELKIEKVNWILNSYDYWWGIFDEFMPIWYHCRANFIDIG